MSRRASFSKREILPDAKYNSITVSRLLNRVMLDGKKYAAEKIVYSALDIIGVRDGKSALEITEKAIKNATPLLEVKARRVGGATYQVPVEVRSDRALSLALRWIIKYTRARNGKSTAEKLAAELLDCYNEQGATIKKREETHKMAEANRAFAHYRW
ncbi:MAG: 30S ribosomal protein S7 [Chloroflexi bacterium]|nr:30S ribosomal protein S7 [Chloroflexota bacterium]